MDTLGIIQLVLLALIFGALARIYLMGANLLTLRKREARAREVLPLSCLDFVKPQESARIKASVQRVPFEPERLFISGLGGKLGAGAWLINDIKIANSSQFAQSGVIPGDMFWTGAIGSFVNFDIVPVYADIEIVVTYVGDNPDGERFYGALIGRDASDPKLRRPKRPKGDASSIAAAIANAGAN